MEAERLEASIGHREAQEKGIFATSAREIERICL